MATPLPSNSASQSAAEQIADLMDQVRSKDTLVLQLTERLEQAAEQLDRLHRLGADKRHGSAGGGGGASSIIEPLTTKIDEAIDAWTQTGPQFDYIVQRLDEIAGAIQGAHLTPAADSKGSAKSTPAPASQPAPAAGGTAGGSFWEKMKSNMMDGTPAPTTPTPAPASTTGVVSAESVPSQSASHDPVQRISAPTPAAVDLETASPEELKEAVIARENYITALVSELRTVEPMPELPADLQSSGLVPEDLVARLLELEGRLKTKMLREELDLSLERARIARERVKLDQVKSQLESQIRRLSGMASDSSAAASHSPASADDPATGKLSWLKRLKGAK